MSNWLRNIQGQLQDFAQEVLAEAAQEVEDPQSELQVANKKATDAERALELEKQNVARLEERLKEAEEKIQDAHEEMSTIQEKLSFMVNTRDEEIKKLRTELEQQSHNRSSWDSDGDDHETEILKQKVADLTKEVQHWKGLAQNDSSKSQSSAEVEKFEEFRRKKEKEIAALIQQHEQNINEMKEAYEEKINSMQGAASSSTSNADLLDAVLLEKEELLEAKRKLEEMVRSKNYDDREKPVMLDLMERSSGTSNSDDIEERLKAAETEVERMRDDMKQVGQEHEEEVKQLKLQNKELVNAYNELNTECEVLKEFQNQHNVRNHQELLLKIDHLKANLIEYEEKYEMCKLEHSETVRQLEKLGADFDRLRGEVSETKARGSDSDAALQEEVEKLRVALETSREERERLRTDVDRFRAAVADIDSELDSLRDANKRLLEENAVMAQSLTNYDSTVKDTLSNSERDLAEFRTEFKKLQQGHREESEALLKVNEELKSEIESLRNRNRLLAEESMLVKEVNAQLKKMEEGGNQRDALMEEKMNLLEEHNSELAREMSNLNDKLSEAEKKVEERERQIQEVERARDELKVKLDEFGDNVSGNNETDEEKDRLREAIVELEKTNETLRVQEIDDREKRSQLEEKHKLLEEEVSSKEASLLRSMERLAELEGQVQEGEYLKSEFERIKLELAAKEESLLASMERLSLLENKEQDADLGKDAEIERLEQELANKELTFQAKINEMSQIQASAQEADMWKEEAEQLREMLREKESKELDSSPSNEHQTNSEKNEKEVEELKSEIERLKEELTEKELNLSAYLNQIITLEASAQEAEQLRQMIREQESNSAQSNEHLAELGRKEQESQLLKVEIERLKQELTNKEINLQASSEQFAGIAEKEREMELLKAEFERIKEELAKKEMNLLQAMERLAELEVKSQEAELLKNEIERLQGELAEIGQQREEMQIKWQHHEQATAAQTGDAERMRAEIEATRQENEQLKGAILQKHEESTMYYNKLQEVSMQMEQLRAQSGNVDQLQQQLKESVELLEKRDRELLRLKEHLILVEETSTKEAIEAEQRETNLRDLVAELQKTHNATATGANESSQMYEAQLVDLRGRLEFVERSAASWKSQFETEKQLHNQAQEALSSLQGVVKELSTDHEKESAMASHRNIDLQARLQEETKQIAHLNSELERIGLDKQAVEEEIEKIRQEAKRANDTIRELEEQNAALCASRKDEEKTKKSGYKIDDEVLRQARRFRP
ncbi:hypothetical protein WR25_10120 [Diploscapter pachys]|uniref:Uncharacterized protein n=1 Tax=Diploscapter pachys TaxID=2018661 RepID=A0A2A2LEK7_9BILA|nr:hypothetical protein WR25_10120 [Diploscapter pachys]